MAYCSLGCDPCCSACRKGQYLTHWCTCCIPPRSVISSHITVCSYISMPTTAKSTSAHPLKTCRTQWTSSVRVLWRTSMSGCTSASRFRLSASKTQLMWLGLTPLLGKITCQDILVLRTRVTFSTVSSCHIVAASNHL